MKETYEATMIALTPQNYHLWIRELQGISEKAKVWQYVDPNGMKPEPEEGEYPEFSQYQILVPAAGGVPIRSQQIGRIAAIITKAAEKYGDLSMEQKEDFKMELSVYKMKAKQVEKVSQGLRIVENALKSSARAYIPLNKMTSSVREIVKILTARYKRSDDQIIEQLHEQFLALKTPPIKSKIEAWVADWENMKAQIIELNVTGLFGSEIIFINEFLQSGRKWAPFFCDHWVMHHRLAKTTIEFYETTREYRLAVESFLNKSKPTSRNQATTASLQRKEQISDKNTSSQSEKGNVSRYRDVIFNEDELYETYKPELLLKEAEKADFIEFHIIKPQPVFREIDSEEEEWLDLSVNKRIEQLTIDNSSIQNDTREKIIPPSTPRQLETSKETSFHTPEPDISDNDPPQLPQTGRTPLNVTKTRQSSSGRSNEINETNVIEGKRTRKPNPRYANYASIAEEMSQFHIAFLPGTARIINQLRTDDLPDPPSHWRALLGHPYADGFMIAASIEWETLFDNETLEIVDQDEAIQPILPLKWVFTYKTDSGGFLAEFKARLLFRGDLHPDGAQEEYATTLAFKVFRALMALVAAFGLKTRQLDAISAFSNTDDDDEPLYCFLPDGFKLRRKVLKVKKSLYGERNSTLLWLRMLTGKFIELGLQQVPGEPCLFYTDGIILFFYANDIVMAYRPDKEEKVEKYVKRFMNMIEIRDMGSFIYFIGVQAIHDIEAKTVHLIPNSSMDKLAKECEVDEDKPPQTSMFNEGLADIAKSASKLAEYLTNPVPSQMRPQTIASVIYMGQPSI